MSKSLYGTLMFFCEDDPEGVLWLFVENDIESLDGAHELNEGDRLIVCDERDAVIFDGVIERDYDTGLTSHSWNPTVVCQMALGFNVRWIQKGWEPDDWARLFIRMKGQKPFRATLCKRVLH